MISNDDTLANAVSGKTARPCDCCIRKRARWYCPADDAFLCQGCDASVHCANPLARRHDRVWLKTASLKPVYLPTWHRGLTRKARTPRHAKHSTLRVPELGGEDTNSSVSHDGETDSEDRIRILYQVPILDPFAPETKTSQEGSYQPSDLDVETLLGKGLDDECCGIDELGFLECSNHNDEEEMMVKEERDDVAMREPFDLSFVYDDGYFIPTTCEAYDEDEKVCTVEEREEEVEERKNTSLRLDYEAISEAWASQQGSSSPWMNGQRPQINLHDSWPQCLGSIGERYEIGVGQGRKGGDGEREARVSRYREKRRRRLFSKKIRYEVRKLNAEKRPRMKGRFVKRSSFPLPSN